MDVFRLDEDTFLETDLIEGYTSMIWSERFVPAGDFEMRTRLIKKTKNLLPLGSLISIRGSKEVMIVDTHEITTDDDGVTELTISGETFEAFLSNRDIVGGVNANEEKPWPMLQTYTSVEAAGLLIWNHVINIAPMITGISEASDEITYLANVEDLIPNIKISDSTSDSETAKKWFIKVEPIYGKVLDILDSIRNVGIRNLRPKNSAAEILTFSGVGVPIRTTTSGVTKLLIDFYNGVDRTGAIVFSHDAGHIVRPHYLFSNRGHYNIAIVDSGPVEDQVFVSEYGVSLGVSGLDRRTTYIRGKDLKAGTATYDEHQEAMAQTGRRFLRKQVPTALIDCTVSENNPYKYKVDYDLGDLVTVFADYGVVQDMVVTEFVRTEDETGEHGYPTLVRDV